MTPLRSLAGTLLLTAWLPVAWSGDVVVNREPLVADTQQRLEQMYQVEIRPGRYWYDKVSGAWGMEGGPMLGQILPGLPIGGTMRQDASSGRTGVVINGRELHAMDVAALQRCVAVQPGRYWVMANGVGGYEGAPPIFDLTQLCAAASRQRGGLECDGSGSCGTSSTRNGVTSVISEGGGRAGVTYNGKYIMTPN